LATKLLRSTHSDVPVGRFWSKLLRLCSGINAYQFHRVVGTSAKKLFSRRLDPSSIECEMLVCQTLLEKEKGSIHAPFHGSCFKRRGTFLWITSSPQAFLYCTKIRTMRLRYSEKTFMPQVVQENSRFESKVSPSGLRAETWPKSLFLSVCTGLGNQPKYSHEKRTVIPPGMTGTAGH
jgi:hypothetical protein